MAAETVKKCAHPVCSCPSPDAEYCSVECATMEKTADIACKCNHATCNAEIDYPAH